MTKHAAASQRPSWTSPLALWVPLDPSGCFTDSYSLKINTTRSNFRVSRAIFTWPLEVFFPQRSLPVVLCSSTIHENEHLILVGFHEFGGCGSIYPWASVTTLFSVHLLLPAKLRLNSDEFGACLWSFYNASRPFLELKAIAAGILVVGHHEFDHSCDLLRYQVCLPNAVIAAHVNALGFL